MKKTINKTPKKITCKNSERDLDSIIELVNKIIDIIDAFKKLINIKK
jgi:transposase